MTELLAPAGNMDALKAAISNGCDAIYLGMTKFGARAYSTNFDEETLKEAVNYAHLRNVKIYVTMNTIVFDDEIDDMKKQVDFINSIGVDGVIVQDLAVFNYIVENFKDLEAHCSTQMGIDDLQGTLLFKELGAKRVVLSREVDIQTVKQIRKQAQIPIEIFVHGALCVSYSGNCLMSGLTGNRSGNRGRCIGSCRKEYEIINVSQNQSLGNHYILSTKDLNTIDYIDQLKDIDSLKIEGRMKEPEYVANVVSRYRMALDGTLSKEDADKLNCTFQRTFTKGYLFGEDKKNITNIDRPNHHGYEIGYVSNVNKGMVQIKLSKPLNQNDTIRIRHNNEDIVLTVARLYDQNKNYISSSDDTCFIQLKEKVSLQDKVYKTKDIRYYDELSKLCDKEYRKYDLDIQVLAYPGCPLIINAQSNGCTCSYESDFILDYALNNPTTKEQIIKQMSRLNDTIYQLHNVEFEQCDAFIPVKVLNQARREIVSLLNQEKTNQKQHRLLNSNGHKSITFPTKRPYLTASVTNKEQYQACKEMGITEIYFDNIVRRNQNHYEPKEGPLLVGGYGGLYEYRHTNPIISDYSFNVVNADAIYQLHALGVQRVTLSYEMNRNHIEECVNRYYQQNNGYPCLEMIIYGRAPLLFTKYCPLKKLNQCGKCKENQFILKNGLDTFPIVSHEDCTCTILNGKELNLIDEIKDIKGVEAFRLNFTLESSEEVKSVIKQAYESLNGIEINSFNPQTDTRGHFNKEIV